MAKPASPECCIACLSRPTGTAEAFFTEEHIIPRALGGELTWYALCKQCNDRFGHTFEKRAKTDPAIRLAIHKLRNVLPDLFGDIEEGQPYIVESGGKRLPAMFRGGEIRALTRTVDGDLWAAPDQAEAAVGGKLKRAGLSADEIDAAWTRYSEGPESTPIELGAGLHAASHPTRLVGPDLGKGETLGKLVALKIAYEFAALHFGAVMLDDTPPLNEIRRALREGDETSPVFQVEYKMTTDRKTEAFHGIAFEGNLPHAVMQVRLFGLLAYRVRFPTLRIEHKPFGLHQDLCTGDQVTAYRDN